MWNKTMKENERVKRQNSKKEFEKNEHACIVEKVSVVSDSNASPYLKLAGPTQKNQSSKLLQFQSLIRSWGSLAWLGWGPGGRRGRKGGREGKRKEGGSGG